MELPDLAMTIGFLVIPPILFFGIVRSRLRAFVVLCCPGLAAHDRGKPVPSCVHTELRQLRAGRFHFCRLDTRFDIRFDMAGNCKHRIAI